MNEPASPEATTRIDTVGAFLVHALELEHESTARYEQLADSMEVHHNREVARLFRQLSAMSAAHADDVATRAHDIELPRFPPWAFKWTCPGAPEGGDYLAETVGYQMTAAQALELALHNETRGQAFYAHVARGSSDAEVRRLAAEMCDEETRHVQQLQALLDRERQRDENVAYDLDPPHAPA